MNYPTSQRRASSNPRAGFRSGAARAFTLVELLVSMTVLTVLLLIVTNVISETQKAWSQASSRTTQFREARAAFDLITRNLSQATLNTYWDYYRSNPGDAATPPSRYERKSELSFICGQAVNLLARGGGGAICSTHAIFFQAPLGVSQEGANAGLNNMLCGRGYFITYASDAPYLPGFLPPSYAKQRFRLMEYSPPAERNRIYVENSRPSDNPTAWFDQDAVTVIAAGETTETRSPTRPVAENIVALIISPRLSPRETGAAGNPTRIAPAYAYDSSVVENATATSPQGTQHLIPPLIEVTMVALDEPSAQRLETLAHSPSLAGDAGAMFTSAASYETDIRLLESYLVDKRLNFRIFRTTIGMRSSKWSL